MITNTGLVYEIIKFDDNYLKDLPDTYMENLTDSQKDFVYYRMGRYAKSELEKLSDAEKNIILQYPVVYFHTWESDEGFLCYVGESIDLLRRTDEHEKTGDDFTKWQSSWIQGENRISYYFSSTDMNKSTSLDIEDCLLRFIQTSLKKVGVMQITCNGRQNKQESYSNKNKRDDIFKEIWGIIKENCFRGVDCFDIEEFLFEERKETYRYANTTIKSNKIVLNVPENILYLKPHCEPEKMDSICETISASDFGFKNWPVVYLHIWEQGNNEFRVYVGEANEILKRTNEHINSAKEQVKAAKKQDGDSKQTYDWHKEWADAVKNGKAHMIVIGHEQMNKSITLDLEHMLITYNMLLGYTSNKRGNEQNRYDNEQLITSFFSEVVKYLCNHPEFGYRFKEIDTMKKESVFLGSTLNKLSSEQIDAKNSILDLIENPEEGYKNMIIVQGGWGTGKTVLAASLFFDLFSMGKDVSFTMNHDQLQDLYVQQAKQNTLGLKSKIETRIKKAANLINDNPEQKFDIVIIDETHLLRGKGENGAAGKQLENIIRKANTTVMFYDPEQHVRFGTLLERDDKDDLDVYFERILSQEGIQVKVKLAQPLTVQFRMDCSDETIQWLKSLTQEGEIKAFPFESRITNYQYSSPERYNRITEHDENDNVIYEIIIVDSIDMLDRIILEKKETSNPSCLVSTFNNSYLKKKVPKDENNPKSDKESVVSTFLPTSDNKHHGWHITGQNGLWTMDKLEKSTTHWIKSKVRGEGDNSIIENSNIQYYEVGSVHDIQGFDLNYAGVIIGESWKSEVGEIMIDLTQQAGVNYAASSSNQLTSKKSAVSNELGVLLSRGKKGIVIYAVDKKLREALFNATKPLK